MVWQVQGPTTSSLPFISWANSGLGEVAHGWMGWLYRRAASTLVERERNGHYLLRSSHELRWCVGSCSTHDCPSSARTLNSVEQRCQVQFCKNLWCSSPTSRPVPATLGAEMSASSVTLPLRMSARRCRDATIRCLAGWCHRTTDRGSLPHRRDCCAVSD